METANAGKSVKKLTTLTGRGLDIKATRGANGPKSLSGVYHHFLAFFGGLNPDDIQDNIEEVTRGDIDNDTIEDDPFIGISLSYTEGSGSVSGLNLMEKICDGMIAIAKALAVPTATNTPTQAESKLQGQAQKLIQKSRSFTHEGTLIMLELHGKPELARTYLLINDDILRGK
ncbi:hypothetical protein GcM3_075020 [Golovinomyces cichoracearum]|uniref:Uncharacterized protein n=1 Tax=Golovinomyces cichoracearum TaxID=62708 RepID=A0A420IR34_9PEZI|nr:hypothetical protein GcM3_075020 [Golovinomyces cichoracearum]